jgi:hypothetical protein
MRGDRGKAGAEQDGNTPQQQRNHAFNLGRQDFDIIIRLT